LTLSRRPDNEARLAAYYKKGLRSTIMTTFALGFLFISLFTIALGIAALVFTSFDALPSSPPHPPQLFDIIRRINTNTIETVDLRGSSTRWQRQEAPPIRNGDDADLEVRRR